LSIYFALALLAGTIGGISLSTLKLSEPRAARTTSYQHYEMGFFWSFYFLHFFRNLVYVSKRACVCLYSRHTTERVSRDNPTVCHGQRRRRHTSYSEQTEEVSTLHVVTSLHHRLMTSSHRLLDGVCCHGYIVPISAHLKSKRCHYQPKIPEHRRSVFQLWRLFDERTNMLRARHVLAISLFLGFVR